MFSYSLLVAAVAAASDAYSADMKSIQDEEGNVLMTSSLALTVTKSAEGDSTTRVVETSATSPGNAFGTKATLSSVYSCIRASVEAPEYECYSNLLTYTTDEATIEFKMIKTSTIPW